MMQSMKTIKILLVILIPLVLGLLLIHECSFAGGMGAAAKTCECVGHEWLLYDRTASDGPRKTICIGMVRATECHQYLGGPTEECNFSSKVTLRTDKQSYEVGENIELVVTNRLNSPIRYYDVCSLHFCQYHRDEWFCEIEDCYASMIVIEAGSSIELKDQAKGLVETRSKYRFEYQTFFDDTIYTIDSNEFAIKQELNLSQ
jgi:hypothetical protein